jgi:hypothetical protein
VAAAKILIVKAVNYIHLACLHACLVSLPALFVPDTSTLILLRRFFANKYALRNLFLLDIYECW